MKSSTEKAAKAVFSKMLKQIKPSKEELEQSVQNINQITGRLKKVIPRDVETRVVGSVVRGTQLSGESDIDIFLLFSKKYSRDRITKEGIDYAKRIAKEKGDRWEVKYAEHPYARIYLNSLGVRADIVPAFNIDNIEDMGTAVDRSPMHAEYINAHLSDKQRDEVRLLKYLLKRQNLYGAEVVTSGFSGYLCELLVYHYGSLLDLFENAAMFILPILLDPKSKVAIHDLELVKRFNSMFIVIDPIDKNRNVAAGVSIETLSKFVLLCRAFLIKPSTSFFVERNVPSSGATSLLASFIKRSGWDAYVIAASVPDKAEDVVWPQLRKVSDFVATYAEKMGFRIYLSMPIMAKEKGLLVFLAPQETLRTRLQKGPSVFIRKAQEEFVRAHKDSMGMMIRGDTIYALDKNKYENLGELLEDVASGKLMVKHKDVTLRGSKVFLNALPKEYAEAVYSELIDKLNV